MCKTLFLNVSTPRYSLSSVASIAPLSTSYVGVSRRVELSLVNLSNLPALFRWDQIDGAAAVESAGFRAVFDPPAGELPGKSEQYVSLELTAYQPGLLSPVCTGQMRIHLIFGLSAPSCFGMLNPHSSACLPVCLPAYRIGFTITQVLACEMEGAAQPLGLAIRVPVRPLVVTAHVSQAEQVRFRARTRVSQSYHQMIASIFINIHQQV